MIIIPRENPVIQNLNSYYLDMGKLLEHYQGELGSGCIHLKSVSNEGIIFFDENNILNGIFRSKESVLQGRHVIDRLMEVLESDNFSVSVYKLSPDKISFWANLQNVEEYYKNLSSEFADLEGLIKKMGSEKHTGFIDVSIGDGKEEGIIFFDYGTILGISCSWENGKFSDSKDALELLVRKSKASGSVFNVSKVSLKTKEEATASESQEKKTPSRVLEMIQELLVVFERLVRADKKIKPEFDTILKRKFVEKVDEFDFLDPFAAEFQFNKGEVIFTGKADDERLLKGVTESLGELADELGMRHRLPENLVLWSKKYSREISTFDLEL